MCPAAAVERPGSQSSSQSCLQLPAAGVSEAEGKPRPRRTPKTGRRWVEAAAGRRLDAPGPEVAVQQDRGAADAGRRQRRPRRHRTAAELERTQLEAEGEAGEEQLRRRQRRSRRHQTAALAGAQLEVEEEEEEEQQVEQLEEWRPHQHRQRRPRRRRRMMQQLPGRASVRNEEEEERRRQRCWSCWRRRRQRRTRGQGAAAAAAGQGTRLTEEACLEPAGPGPGAWSRGAAREPSAHCPEYLARMKLPSWCESPEPGFLPGSSLASQ